MLTAIAVSPVVSLELFDVGLRNRLLHFAAVPVDGVRFERDDLVHDVVIQKRHEGETALLLSVAVHQHLSFY